MKLIIGFVLCAFISQSYAQVVINDRNAVARNIGSFSGIKVSGGIDVYLSQGNEYALAVSASEDKYRDAIKTEVKNGILTIWFDGGSLNFGGNRNLKAYISFKSLSSLDGSGACDINFTEKFTANSFRIKLSGACDVEGRIAVEDLDVDISGASTVKVSGSADNLKIRASGASDLKNFDLVANHCKADISGASDVRVTVNNSLSARASGASNFYYRGNPEKKDVSESGASTISRRD